MVLKTLILLVSALCFTSSQLMTCTYSFTGVVDGSRYQCDLSLNNPNGLDDAVSIGGVHSGSYMDPYGNLISTYNDSSVQIVTFAGISKNIPSAICRQFPNAGLLRFYSSKLQILSATRCSKASMLLLQDNLIEEALTDLCQFQPEVKDIHLPYNKLKVLSNEVVKSCKNLQYFNVGNNQLTAISSTFFATTPIIQSISFGGNPIKTIPNGLFNGLTELRTLYMRDLLITDLPLNIFPTVNKIDYLEIGNNKFTQYRPEWFQNLKNLYQLYMDSNQIPIPSDFFKPMPSLVFISMENCNISVVDPKWFSTLSSLYNLNLYRNNIYEIPDNTFAATNALNIFLDIRSNKLKTISSKWFSTVTLQRIRDLNVDNNEVNAIDPLFLELSTNLNGFSLNNNKCYTGPKITDFVAKRSSYMPGFKTCIDNFAYQNW